MGERGRLPEMLPQAGFPHLTDEQALWCGSIPRLPAHDGHYLSRGWTEKD